MELSKRAFLVFVTLFF